MTVPARRMKRHLSFTFLDMPVSLKFMKAPTGTLFFAGTLGSDKVQGFAYRDGGYIAQSDSLRRRDELSFVQAIRAKA